MTGGTRRSRGGLEGSTPGPAPGTGRRAARPREPEDPREAAREIALRQLSHGPRTRAQLAAAMARRGVPEEDARAVLDRFEEVDLVDDQEFARQWVETRHSGRGLARRALAHELRQRGVADGTVREAVAEVRPEDELAAARELVRRRLRALRDDDPARRTRRLTGMLARKGYGAGVAMEAIRAELRAAELDDLDDVAVPDPED